MLRNICSKLYNHTYTTSYLKTTAAAVRYLFTRAGSFFGSKASTAHAFGMQRYEYTITYRLGEQMPIADILSKSIEKDGPLALEIDMDTELMNKAAMQRRFQTELESVNMIEDVPLPTQHLMQLLEETYKDEGLKQLSEVIKTGRPDVNPKIEPSVRTYLDIREELVVDHGIVF